MAFESRAIVYSSLYRGWLLQVVHVTRDDRSVLMQSEYETFLGNDVVHDELETLDEAIAAGQRMADFCIDKQRHRESRTTS